MQTPSPQEIEREVAALRDLRRRSSQQGPGSIPLDPDLPPNGPVSSSAGGYWDNYNTPPNKPIPENDSPPDQDDGSEDPSHLFWVPAHLHPEIAPAEFRAFLKEHTRPHPEGGAPLGRSLSSASGLLRKKSMLSKQYDPSAHDNVEDEKVVTVKRTRSSIYSTAGPQLTISDLQKLEELAEEAAKSDDPSKLRSVLRRSLSLNVAPSFIDQMDDIPDIDEADAPIIVPRPGQILRRTARTKIRKPGLSGDGGGHRFASTRRGARTAKPDIEIASDGGHDSESSHTHSTAKDQGERPASFSEEAFILDAYGDRRDSMTSTRSSAEDDDVLSTQSHSSAPTSAPQSTAHGTAGHRPPSPPLPLTEPSQSAPAPRTQQTVRRVSPPPGQQSQRQEAQAPVLHHPAPQRHLEVPPKAAQPARTPSPEASRPAPSTSPDPFRRSPSAPPVASTVSEPTVPTSHSMSPTPSLRSTKSEKAKEKEKKGLLKTMWGSDKKKDKAFEGSRESREREGVKEKDGGFFGSLFGGKKKHEEPEPHGRGLLAGAGPAAAAALLGASKTKNQPPPPSPTLQASFARYPIHVERAVYRLSHIKLANPRRPLYEQVLISNLMFWYLGVINKVTPAPPSNSSSSPSGEGNQTAAGQEANGGPPREEKEKAERERAEKEKAEKEERERAERQRIEQEKEREAREKERAAEKDPRKRGTLVKNVPPGTGPGSQSRRAEMPIRSPQYDVQHRIMEQEGGYNMPPGHGRPMGRTTSLPGGGLPHHGPPGPHGPPPGPPGPGGPYPPPHHHPQYPPQQPYPPQQYPQQNFMQFAPPLPPGAIPPPQADQWIGAATNSREGPYAIANGPGPMNGPPPGHPARSRSPPTKGQPHPHSHPPHHPQPNGATPQQGGPRAMGRSTSANAGGPPPPRQQRSPPGPNMNGAWGAPQQQQRRGPSPQPPIGGRPRRNSAGPGEGPVAWQQPPPQRGGPVVR
ncbi:hypothetical protein FRB99_004580 [Tulasnella sp. 403]|nr:hypothetical protein FRB99_004580 [Tulasnella sp. 403]